MPCLRLLCLLAALIVGLRGAEARAEPGAEEGSAASEAEAEAHLTAGRKLYDKQEYASALEAYRLALGTDGGRGATREQRVRAYALIGAISTVLGDLRQARRAFRRLLLLEPRYTLNDPSFSPKILNLFAEVARRMPRPAAAGLQAARPLVSAGRWAELRVTARNAGAVRRVLALVRRTSAPRFRRLPMERLPDGSFVLRVEQSGGALEYYFEADGEHGELVGRLGSARNPARVEIGDPPTPANPGLSGSALGNGGRGSGNDTVAPRPWYRRWWVWTLGAAVVGGGVAAAVVLTRPSAPELPPATLPPAQLP